jgi:hypothetical protein
VKRFELKPSGAMSSRILVVSSLVVIALLSISTLIFVRSNGFTQQNSRGPNCPTSVLKTQIDARTATLNDQKAIQLAELSSEYTTLAKTHQVSFTSIYNNWIFDTKSCAVRWDSVNALFSVYNSSTTFAGYLAVKMSPNLNSIKSATFEPASTLGSNSVGSNFEAGYEYNYVGLDDTQAKWTVPGVSIPSVGCYTQCYMSNWVGESTSGGGGGVFAQGGSQSRIDCYFICGYSYAIWYQFPSSMSNEQTCGSANPGDTIVAEMSYNSGYDYVYVYDYANGHTCSSSVFAGTSNPDYSQYMLERQKAQPCNCFATLPKFGSVTYYNAMIDYTPIYDFSPDYSVYMQQSQLDVALGNVQYSSNLLSYFVLTYKSSS